MLQLQINAQAALKRSISEIRRASAEKSPKAFMDLYLSHYRKAPFSRMHLELFDLLLKMTSSRSAREAIAAPRGHAKTTLIGTAYVLWSALYRREFFILLVTATQDLAKGLLKTVKDEIRNNPLLANDFPEVCGPPPSQVTTERWRAHDIVLRNGVGITALGAGQGIRGRKQGPHRPSLIIVDDLESQESVANEEQRDKTAEWFEKTLVPAGGPTTNIVLIGTVLHHDSLLAKKLDPRKSGGWRGHKYRAIENWADDPILWENWEAIYRGQEVHKGASGPDAAGAYFRESEKPMLAGSKVLWPEQEDYLALMLMKMRGGSASFQSEKQNEPLDPAECIFKEELFQFWDAPGRTAKDLIAEVGPKGKLFGGCDPSLGQRNGDFTAIVTVLKDPKTSKFYVLDADLAKRGSDQTLEKIIQLACLYRYTAFAFEANQFQSVLAEDLKRRVGHKGLRLKVEPVTSRTNKVGRIATLETLVSQGLLLFSRRQHLLLDQLRLFPQASHDDGPDALEMAIELAQTHREHVFSVTYY